MPWFCEQWLDFRTRGSHDILSQTSKEQFYCHQSTECYTISIWANQCFPWQILNDSAHAIFFFNNGALRGLLADLFNGYLTVTAYRYF